MPNPQASAAFTAAMDRVRDEMAVATNPAVEAVGEIMTLYLQAHPVAAEALLAEDKTLAGAYMAMEQYARKNRGGASTVCVPPARRGPARIAPDEHERLPDGRGRSALLRRPSQNLTGGFRNNG